jgi:uncharacterized membrane protein
MPVLLRRAFVAASCLWAALLVVVPLLASRTHASALASTVVVAVYAIGSLVCHQLPERSYHLWAAQMPVCARCAGIYFGAAFSATLFPVAQPFTAAHTGVRPRDQSPRVLIALASLPTIATLVFEWTTGITPSNALRLAAGVPIGIVVAWLVVSAAENRVN